MFYLSQVKLDFNSCTITNLQGLQSGRFITRSVPIKDFRSKYGVIITRCVLAQMSNDSTIPVYIVYEGQLKNPMVGGIFCEGTFKMIHADLFSHYGLKSSDYEVKSICEEFNSGASSIISNIGDLAIESIFPTDNSRLSLKELADKFNNLVDLRYSYENFSSQDDAEYFVSISTHNVMTRMDKSWYLMPCTIEFKNSVKTIGYCDVQPELEIAIPWKLLDAKLDSKLEKLRKNITCIRPLIVSPDNVDDVRVSEGLELSIVPSKELELLSTNE